MRCSQNNEFTVSAIAFQTTDHKNKLRRSLLSSLPTFAKSNKTYIVLLDDKNCFH